MGTHFPSEKNANSSRNWFVFDADGEVVGRMASKIARVLRGKHKPTFMEHQDVGDFVVVINAAKVRFTGNKLDQKVYRYHSGYVGGLKEETARSLQERKPEEVIRLAVRGMMPKNPLGRKQLSKLKIYAGEEHPHEAQQPEPLTV